MNPRVLAVVVTFEPSINSFRQVIEALAPQVKEMCVVDNGSSNQQQLIELLRNQTGVISLPQQTNLGLGAAHNLGIQYAKEHDFTHVLLMDQDSVANTDMVTKLIAAATLKQSELISAVGASYTNSAHTTESFFVRFGWLKFQRRYCHQQDSHGCVLADFLISSGSLISLSSLQEIGLMDESLFIDHVDTEWFLRAKAKSYQAFGVCGAVMTHALGEQTHQINLGGRERNVPQHKPFRYYYIFRNSLLLYKRRQISWLWRWNDLQRLLMIFVMYAMLKGPRGQNAKMMFKGVMDGLRGRSGPML